MIPEIGNFLLCLSLLICTSAALLPFFSKLHPRFARSIEQLSALTTYVFCLISGAMICLAVSLVQNDFSVAYVANHSNTQLPLRYCIASLWGGHEGSLLLWIWILALWMTLFNFKSKILPATLKHKILAVLHAVGVGFLLFILITSNPFERWLPFFPADGQDLNPLLQDFGLIVHPPMLYMGYVGFSVAFAFAVAALWQGQFESAWAKWLRPWVLAAWSFLTLGIALGSWWAYYELGWGGWWFWDPVENASLMPWIVGTALLHSLSAFDKRGVFVAWTLLLAILSFSLSLLGTFLVRSGVLTSVHAFANDPERGMFILIYLSIVIGTSLILYAWRANKITSDSVYAIVSKESALLFNNVLLMVMLSVVLLGTLFPLIASALDWRKISIGAPYYNRFFTPLSLMALIVMAIAPRISWGQHTKTISALLPIILFSVFVGLFVPYLLFSEIKLWIAVTTIAVAWLCMHLLVDLFNKMSALKSLSPPKSIATLPASYVAMLIAHLGCAVLAIGIAYSSVYSVEKDVRMSLSSEPVEIDNYRFKMVDLEIHKIDNYQAQRAKIKVEKKRHGNYIEQDVLFPEKRFYPVQNNVMTEAAIRPSLWADLYVSMGEAIDEQSWAMRIYYKPFVRWIWLGALFIALGGFIAVFDRRYRPAQRNTQ